MVLALILYHILKGFVLARLLVQMFNRQCLFGTKLYPISVRESSFFFYEFREHKEWRSVKIIVAVEKSFISCFVLVYDAVTVVM